MRSETATFFNAARTWDTRTLFYSGFFHESYVSFFGSEILSPNARFHDEILQVSVKRAHVFILCTLAGRGK